MHPFLDTLVQVVLVTAEVYPLLTFQMVLKKSIGEEKRKFSKLLFRYSKFSKLALFGDMPPID